MLDFDIHYLITFDDEGELEGISDLRTVLDIFMDLARQGFKFTYKIVEIQW